MIFQREDSILLLLVDLNNFKIARIVTGRVVARYNPPVLNITTFQRTWNKFTSSFSCEVSIKSHNILWNKSTTLSELVFKQLMHAYTLQSLNFSFLYSEQIITIWGTFLLLLQVCNLFLLYVMRRDGECCIRKSKKYDKNLWKEGRIVNIMERWKDVRGAGVSEQIYSHKLICQFSVFLGRYGLKTQHGTEL